MTTIKIKVKHLIIVIILVLLLLFVLPYAYLFYADKISDDKPKIAASMYKNYIDSFPFVKNKDRAIFSLAIKSFYIKGGSYYEKLFTDGSSMNSSYISKDMVNNAISLYKNILKNYKQGPYYEKSYNNLLYIYTYAAKIKAGEELISEGESSNNKFVRLMASEYKMYYSMVAKHYPQVLKLGTRLLSEYGNDRDLYRIMGDTCLLNKDFNNAIYYYNKAAGCPLQKYDNTCYTLFQDTNYPERISRIQTLKASSSKNTLVKGRVTVLGTGIPFAHVYLKDIDDNGMYSGDESEPSFGVTDMDGNYTIKSAPHGSYKLMLVIPGFLLNNSVLSENTASNITLYDSKSAHYDFNFVNPLKLKVEHNLTPDKGYVELSWEPIQNAAFYNIHAILFENPLKPNGSSTWIQISDEIATDSYRLNLDEINIKNTSYSISDSGLVNPQAYLGTFYPGCSVPIFVNAYDKSGVLLTSSIPKVVLYNALPIITVKNSGLTEGERLILEGKPEKGEKALQSELKSKPDNIKLMNILSNIYAKGTRIYINKPNRKALGQDLNRAIALNNRLYNLTKNPEYIRKSNYIYQYELKDYKGLLTNYGLIPSSQLNAYDYESLGQANLLLGKFEEAGYSFDKMYKAKEFTQMTSLNPIFLKLYNKEFDDALIMLKKTNLRIYKVSTQELNDHIKYLEAATYSVTEYKSFKKILSMIFMHRLADTYSVEYKDLIRQIKDPHLIGIINQALSYHGIY